VAESAADFAIVDAGPPTRVALLAPAAGELVDAGTSYDVAFTAADNVGVARYDLLYSADEGASWTAVATGVPASPYPWAVPVPPSLPHGARLYVVAYDAAGDSAGAIGPSFVIGDTRPPVVHVLAPNGGEAWMEGSSHDITWTATDNVAVDSVSLDYSLHGDPGPWVAIAHGLASSGTYSWTVPAGVSDSARVRVEAYDSAALSAGDQSDGLFQVVAAIAAPGSGAAVFALGAPLPNPSRGGLLMRFSLPAAGSATLEIVGVKGEIWWRRTLADLPAGPHAVGWDGRDAGGRRVPLGLYFLRLTSRFGERTAKLVRVP
jgi:hypothetical protein